MSAEVPSDTADDQIDNGEDAEASTLPGRLGARKPQPRWKRETNKWARTLHVYTSMIALLVILFFGFSGLTLNHPTWTLGDGVNTKKESGTLPLEITDSGGNVDFLAVSEYIRDKYSVSGHVDSYDVVNGQGSIAYKNAGYAADLFFDVATKKFELTIEQQGWVGVMNDLHKGRDTSSTWKWIIDISAIFLVVVSITGLLMQLFLRKRRRTALLSAAVGAVVVLVLIFVTLR